MSSRQEHNVGLSCEFFYLSWLGRIYHVSSHDDALVNAEHDAFDELIAFGLHRFFFENAASFFQGVDSFVFEFYEPK